MGQLWLLESIHRKNESINQFPDFQKFVWQITDYFAK